MKTYDTLVLDRLQNFMNDAGIDDHTIIGGVTLQQKGYQKLAAKMRVRSISEINDMINQLIQKLRSDKSIAEAYTNIIEATDDKYTFERDFLGNVTVRDSQTGEEHFLMGSTASELLDALDHPDVDKQELLAHYLHEPITEDDDMLTDPSYDSELDSNQGTYNFPWKYGAHHGTATAEYYMSGGKPVIKVVSVRNASGDEVHVGNGASEELKKQAVEFIGNA